MRSSGPGSCTTWSRTRCSVTSTQEFVLGTNRASASTGRRIVRVCAPDTAARTTMPCATLWPWPPHLPQGREDTRVDQCHAALQREPRRDLPSDHPALNAALFVPGGSANPSGHEPAPDYRGHRQIPGHRRLRCACERHRRICRTTPKPVQVRFRTPRIRAGNDPGISGLRRTRPWTAEPGIPTVRHLGPNPPSEHRRPKRYRRFGVPRTGSGWRVPGRKGAFRGSRRCMS